MNIYKEYSGIQRDVTWSDINYTPFASRSYLHALGKSLAGNRNYILEGCVFSKNAGVDGSVTAGYVFDANSGEVVRVEAQTITETLATDLWTLVKTTSYDAAGLNNYRTGGPNNNYQQERMVLTNVASIGAGFDIENTSALDVWVDVPDAEVTSSTTGVTIAAGGTTGVAFHKVGDTVHFIANIVLSTDGTFTPAKSITLRIPDTHFQVDPVDTSNNAIFTPGIVSDTTSSPDTPEVAYVQFKDNTPNYVDFIVVKPTNYSASHSSYRILINASLRIAS